MSFLGQKDGPLFGGLLRGSARPVLAVGVLLSSAGVARAQTGQIACSVTDNGATARGTVAVEQEGRKVAAGSCSAALSVPAGRYEAVVRLEGALDNPSKRVDVEVQPGKTSPVAVNFETAVLEVRIETKGQRGTGMVTVFQDARRIGTLGAGVPARLSVGSYEVVVRLGGQERRYPVDLRAGQRRLVRAQF